MIEIGRELADAIEANLAIWVKSCVEQRCLEGLGQVPEEASALIDEASREALAAVMPALHSLLDSDVDQQWTTPLAMIAVAVRYPTEVLRRLAVPSLERDRFVAERFPNDLYALTPANLADLGEDVGELAISWGAAKAWEHKQRHKPRS